MSGEINGADVLVQVNIGDDVTPNWINKASQRNVVITESLTTVDTSSKESRNETHLPGRYSSTFTLDALYIPGDPSFKDLQLRMRNGLQVRVRVTENGVNYEQALATITSLVKTAQDQQAVLANATFKLTGPWEAAA